MAPVVTSYSLPSQPLEIKITWIKPYDNSEPVIDYEILIQKADGSFAEATECNGRTTSIIQSMLCYVPVQTLRAAPFNLPYDKLVVMKARARNQFGFGDYSETNTAGARVQVEPVQMPPITLDIVTSTINTIKLDWNALVGAETGSSPILSYHLQMDSGVGWADVRG